MTCPDAASCPVADPGIPRHLRSHVIAAGTSWFNVSRHAAVFNSSGAGDSRFAPLLGAGGRPVPHVYLAQNPIGALAETALHDVWGAASVVQRSDLRGRSLRRLTCLTDLRVADLRDQHLDRYGLRRGELVSSPSEHYACTRRWAARRRAGPIGGQPVTGLMWHSRQVEIAAAHAAAPMQILLTAVEQASEVAVIYGSTASGDRWFDTVEVYPDLGEAQGLALVTDLCVQLGLSVEDDG